MPDKSHDVARRLAGLELNLLRQIDALPAPTFEGAKIAEAGTPVYDINVELLFYRFPLAKRGATPSFADIAAHPAFGAETTTTSTLAPYRLLIHYLITLAPTTGRSWRRCRFLPKTLHSSRGKSVNTSSGRALCAIQSP